MTTGDTSAPQGGVDWELSEAERLMWEARTKEQRVLAMRRHSEAIRNMMQAELMPSFQAALGKILDAKLAPFGKQYEATVELFLQLRREDYTARKEQQEQFDARFDAFAAALDPIIAIVTSRPAERAKERAELEARLDRKRERLDEHERRISRLEQHLGLDGDGG